MSAFLHLAAITGGGPGSDKPVRINPALVAEVEPLDAGTLAVRFAGDHEPEVVRCTLAEWDALVEPAAGTEAVA